MLVARRVRVGVFESDLDEAVTTNRALLHQLPHDGVLALRLVLLPHGAQQLGHDRLGGVR